MVQYDIIPKPTNPLWPKTKLNGQNAKKQTQNKLEHETEQKRSGQRYTHFKNHSECIELIRKSERHT